MSVFNLSSLSRQLMFFFQSLPRNRIIQINYYNQFYQMVQESSPSSFIKKFHSILKNKNFEGIIRYDEPNAKIFIFDKEKLEIQILPFYFRHNKFTSLIRQLNHYGFKKLRSDPVLTFTHPTLLKGHKFMEIISKKKTQRLVPENEERITNIQEQQITPQFSNYNERRHQELLQNNDHRFFVDLIPLQTNNPQFIHQNISSFDNASFMVLTQQNSQVITYLLSLQQPNLSNGFIGYFRSF